MRAVIAVCLSTLLCLPTIGRDPKDNTEVVKEQVSKMKPGKKIVVKLLTNEKLKGTLLGSDATTLRMMIVENRIQTERSLAFSEIKELSTPTPGWVVGVMIGLGVIAAMGIVAAAGVLDN